MKKLRILSLALTAILVTACSSPGPMQTMRGPLHTPVFNPIIINNIKDGSNRVYFKEWTTMYENKEYQQWGVFFITNKGAYMADWDTHEYKYNLLYKIDSKNIKSISNSKVVRKMWIDSDLLIIADKKGHEVGFALNGKNAARSFLNKLIKK